MSYPWNDRASRGLKNTGLLLPIFLLLVLFHGHATEALTSPRQPSNQLVSHRASLSELSATTSTTTASAAEELEEWKKTLGVSTGGRRQRRRQKRKSKAATAGSSDGNKSSSKSTKSSNDEEPTLSSEEIQSVTLLPNNNDNDDNNFMAHIQLHNGTQFTVHPPSLHQRRDQAVWLAVRKQVNVTASEFSAVLDKSFFTSREKLLHIKQGLASPAPFNKQACDWGLRMEPKALDAYRKATGNTVHETGLHIATSTANDETLYYLGASPDGLVTTNDTSSEGLLEIKSLWGRRHQKELPKFEHCPNRFYAQIQGQLAICDKEWCDLMLYIPPRPQAKRRHYGIVRVPRNREYWETELKPALQAFVREIHE
ncbi:YqaJ-like viral recombinase domain [Seminavis robusta]|uniref:YqaJ-like viral recombinase domain n=1 Tax=Seminavis robusta TaxID=568900 RepID=A0A9N8E2B5_9STRA|nr:YqaJ-like viral recombinase domain [Seminavis robusta]|eukprot:Sro545_g163900.1 YqaJ-like viral recombinase domain (369) ;mRNA; f:40425-41531